MTASVIAVDIGGTKTVVCLVDSRGQIRSSRRAPSRASDGPGAVIGTVVRLAREVAQQHEEDIRGVGVATAGVVDAGAGRIVSSTDTFARWAGTPVAALLRAELADLIGAEGVVNVQNDVDAHALGEVTSGAGTGARSALVVAVGTGVGAGIIIDGKPFRGARHVAGEIAHIPMPGAEHLRCPCGRDGHLEAIGSGAGLQRHFVSLGGSPEYVDGRSVADLARRGDALALRAIQDSAAAVGRGIAAAATLLDPERVIVTGGLTQIGERWWNAMDEAFRAEVIDALADVPLLPGRLGGDAPLIGAAAAAWQQWGGRPWPATQKAS